LNSLLEDSNPVAGEDKPSPQRGFLFAAWLTIFSLAAVVTTYYSITETRLIIEEHPDSPRWALYGKMFFSVANIGFLTGLWMWRRWGFYGLTGSTVAIFLINGFSGYSWLESSYGFIGLLLLIVLGWLNGKWRHFH
jgi:hypothetical protein